MWLRSAALTGALLLGLAAIAIQGVFVWMHHSLPMTKGTLAVAGLSAPVEITRDQWGVPHIFALSRSDAFFAEGFVHAQDRLWQMEFNRRTGRGRLAETLGPRALPYDRMMRAFDLAGLAARLAPRLPPATRQSLDAYAAGVNAYLATRKGPLPPEFLLTGITPAPWTAEDSIILIKLMQLNLCENAFSEANHAKVLRAAMPETFAALFPELPAPLPRLAALYDAALPQHAEAGPPVPLRGASNNWAVDGRWTKSGKPLLANDPHLGLSIPSIWYLAHLSYEGRNIIGASLAGVPSIVLGRNEHLAWAYTNTGADVQDLVIEKLSPETPEHYVSPEGVRPFMLHSETIKVRGGADVTETFRTTAQGPVIPSDLKWLAGIVPDGHVVAFDWDALKDGDMTIAAGLDLMEAEDGAAFVHALEPYVAPMQNMVYADSAGHIGFIAPGHVPVRAAMNATHGLLPVPGWKAGYDWVGLIPFAELPHRTDPPTGYIVTANNKIVGDDYPYVLTYEWDADARARRIESLLTARHDHDLASFEAMQRDAVSLETRAILPKMMASLSRVRPHHALARDALTRLAAWDGTMAADRPEPLIFASWFREAITQFVDDAVGSADRDLVLGWHFAPLSRALDGESAETRLCGGDGLTADCDRLISDAFDRALSRLEASDGRFVSLWRWGHSHKAVMAHRPFGLVPGLASFFNREIPSDGGADTINRGAMELTSARPFANVHGSSYRAIYDLDPAGHSVFIIPTGESGNPLSRHYDDLMGPWARGETIPMETDPARIQAASGERLTLMPAAAR
jgi:penicillin amidase